MVRLLNRQAMMTAFDEMPDDLNARRKEIADQHVFQFEVDLRSGDPGDVDQIIDQVRKMFNLALDGLMCFFDCLGRIVPGELRYSDRIADGAERIAQLMGKRRQEIILAAVDIQQLVFCCAP